MADASGSVVTLHRHARPSNGTFFDAGRLYVWGYVAFLAACGAGAGVLLAGIILAAWDQRARGAQN